MPSTAAHLSNNRIWSVLSILYFAPGKSFLNSAAQLNSALFSWIRFKATFTLMQEAGIVSRCKQEWTRLSGDKRKKRSFVSVFIAAGLIFVFRVK